jgi:hypothetical protein
VIAIPKHPSIPGNDMSLPSEFGIARQDMRHKKIVGKIEYAESIDICTIHQFNDFADGL